jgi:hypothetical protein
MELIRSLVNAVSKIAAELEQAPSTIAKTWAEVDPINKAKAKADADAAIAALLARMNETKNDVGK